MLKKVSFEIEIDNAWIDYCVKYNDVFMPSTCGYWMRGMEHDETGWLCYEFEGPQQYQNNVEDSAEYPAIVKAWRNGEELPKFWHRLNKGASIKAWTEGVKRFGVDWYQNTDGTRDDMVIQMALLGEIVYG